MGITGEQLRRQIAHVCEYARTHGWRYGDSHSVPPCQDGWIACDRMIARALWDLGYRDQKAGGWNVRELASALPRWGFKVSHNMADVRANSIVIVGRGADQYYHAFFVVSRSGNNCTKYDCGSNDRVRTVQPFVNVPIMEWSDRFFFAVYWLEDGGEKKTAPEVIDKRYKFEPKTVMLGSTGVTVLLLQEILKARGFYNGSLDRDFGPLTKMALMHYQEQRMKMGVDLGTNGNGEPDGICGPKTWQDLIAL